MSFSKRTLVQVAWFYVGLTIMAFGYALIIRPGLGTSPWDVFHIGVQGQTGVPLARVMQLAGLAIIGLNWALGIRPTVGMVLNMLSYGPILQVLLPQVPLPEGPFFRWAMLLAGMLIAGLGTALYVSADLGSGPRDGLMIGLTRKLSIPVGLVKNLIDVTVAFGGWRLGGPLGLGTVVLALGLGPSVQLGMSVVRRLAEHQPFSAFVHPVQLKKA